MRTFTSLLVFCAISSMAFGQQPKELRFNKETNLIEAVYYYDNGLISQKGTFNLDRKLHGEWISYDEQGNKISIGTYVNGVKSGKWLFWDHGIKKEVEYNHNVIASVDGLEVETKLAKNNK